jgi:SAM-dependent methyltransferase
MTGFLTYAVTIFISSMHLFLIQPIIAKQILPLFGGSANVWTTCLFFFQFLLLLGYCYAHTLARLPARFQPVVHGILLAVSLTSLPIVASLGKASGDASPVLRLLVLLLTTVGLPYFLLATTSPLIQSWYARTQSSPYRLFALSNAASLLGLLAYPFLLEPWFTTLTQAYLWSGGYVVFVIFCVAAAVFSLRTPEKKHDANSVTASVSFVPPAAADVIVWIMLAALASLTLVSVTSFIAANVASAPLIWIGPLTLYLITFILAFEGRRIWHGWGIGAVAVLFAGAMLATYSNDDFISEYSESLPLFLIGLFLICLFCHGQLAESKPAPRYLTFYYIMISAGGALGSLGGSVIAPVLLNGDFEMPATLAAVAFVFYWKMRRKGRALVTAASAGIIALVALAAWGIADQINGARLLERNFYSSLRVVDEIDVSEPVRRLEHGQVEHGLQYLSPTRRREPISYYSETSGIGYAIARQRKLLQKPLSIGVIGLGAGVIAAYGEAGGRVRYYEINPQVIDIAQRQFTYLADCPAETSVALGDARLTLEHESPQNFDILAVDAFSGDAIPMHLLTREAVKIYRRHLAPGGIIAFHISNRFVDLAAPLAAIAKSEHLDVRLVTDNPVGETEDSALSTSDWLLIAPDPSWWGPNERADIHVVPLIGTESVWTDDFNNLLSALRRP